ncbi:MAG: hypothetical protein WC702_02365 [Patescibacteria group bacterium]|jgi:hypothetical protein
MKKILYFLPLVLIALTLTAFGCQKFGGGSPKVHVPSGWTTYSDTAYNFAVSYPDTMELRERPSEDQDSTYAGLNGKFFVSIRDISREGEGPATLALFYAFKNVSVEQFSEALQASDQGNIAIGEITDVTQGGIAMKKMISTTAIGMDKTHYLFQNGEDLIVVSVILGEEEVFKPIFETITKVSE